MMRVSSLWRRLTVSLLLFAIGFITIALSDFHATAGNVRHSTNPTPTSISKLVYAKNYTTSQKWAIFSSNPDGSGEQQLTTGPNDTQPAISRDGAKVAFARENSVGNYDIYLVSSSGGVPQRVTNGSEDEMEPAWSPLGDKLAFVRGTDSTFLQDACDEGCGHRADIYVRNANGTETRLTNSGLNTDPTWSPDGNWIAFSRRPTPADDPDIYKVNVANGTPIQLTDNSVDDGEPAWAPDNMALLAYTSDYFRFGNAASALPPGKMPVGNVTSQPNDPRVIPTIKLLNPNNVNGEPIGNTITNACEPAWAANGQQMTYTFIVDDVECPQNSTPCKGWPALGFLNVNGTAMTKLTTEIRGMNGVWSPSRSGN